MAKKLKNSKSSIAATTENISYTGNVTLKLRKGNRVIKTIYKSNNGTLRLFKGIALGLLQGFSASIDSYLPHFIGVGSNEGPTPLSINSPKLPGEYGRSRLFSGTMNVTRDSVVAPFEGIIDNNITKGEPIKNVGLYGTSDTETLLAFIILDEAYTIPQGMNLLIQWEISIQNKV